MTASLRVAAHRQDMPTVAEVGGSTTPGGIKLSLPVNSSRIPGKKIASRGWSMASHSITHRNTAGSWIPGAWMASCILLAWADSVQESSSIISRDSDWELSSQRHLWRNPSRSSLAAPSSIRGRFTFMEMDCWCFWMSSFTSGNARSSEWRFRTLTRSDERASLEVSSSERKADKLLVRSSPRINCNLTNLAMSVRTRVCSNSLMPPISCMVWRRMAWMCSTVIYGLQLTFN